MSAEQPMKPKISTIDFPDLGVDVAAGLRQLADEIKEGKHPELKFVLTVIVNRDGSYTSLGLGQYSTLEAIGAMVRATTSLAE